MRKFFAMIFILQLFIFSSVSAETQKIMAQGEYEIGSRDTREMAGKIALEYAMRSAMMQAGVHIESYSEVNNFKLTQDEIKSVTSGLLRVIDKKIEYAENGRLCIAKIIAVIDIEKDLPNFIKNRGEDKNFVEIKDLKNHIGETLNLSGRVVKSYENNGNVFFTLKDASGDIACVLFAKTNRENKNYYKHISNSLKNKSQLTLKGTVATYKGKIELKVWQVHE